MFENMFKTKSIEELNVKLKDKKEAERVDNRRRLVTQFVLQKSCEVTGSFEEAHSVARRVVDTMKADGSFEELADKLELEEKAKSEDKYNRVCAAVMLRLTEGN